MESEEVESVSETPLMRKVENFVIRVSVINHFARNPNIISKFHN
jgi:hypothetical protein